jgi:von willebrand factor-binding protein, putative
MFKSDKKEVFSFRKYKGYGLASAVIAAFFFASSVSADVVNNGDGTTTLSNDKASTVVDTAKFKDNTDKTATEIFNEGGYEAEAVTTGTDAVASEVSTKVSYETEDGTKIDNDVSETSTVTKDVDYKFTGKSGKEYVGTDAPSTVNQDLGKKDQIEQDGKKYEYVRTETTAGESTGLTNTSFNDVTTKASVEGMYNQDGSIKYDRIKNGSRVWVLEELADGSYGNYVLIENAQNLDDAAIKEAAKTATKKFSKAEVDAKGGFKDTDSVVVYETNTYASRNVKKSVVGHELDYGFTAMGASMYKPVIDDIYSTGLVKDLTKQGDVYYYKGARVYTDGDVVTGERPPVEYSEIEDGKAFASMSGRNTSYDLKPDYPFVDRGGYNFYTPFQYGHILFDFLSQQNSQVDAMVRKWTHIDNVGDLYLEDALFFGGAASGGTVSARESYYGLMDLVYGWMNEDLATKHNISGDRIHGFSDKSASAINDRPVSSKKVDFVSNIKKENTNEGSVESKINYEGAFDILDAEIRSEIEATYTKDRAKRVALYMKRFYPGAVESIADFDNISLDEYMRLIPLSEIASRMNGPEAVYSSLTNISKYREMYGFTPIVDGYVASSVYNGDSGISLDSEWHAVRNSPGLVTTTTESFTYHDEITPLRAYRLNADDNVVRHIYAEVKKGSVVATYSDEDGNKLVDDVNVKTDEYAGEDYTTEAKQIRPIYDVETVNGLTKTTITRYELIKTPDNANGKVVAETTITVPYVYRKVVNVDINGSVIATYKDEDGNVLASEEKVITNQNAGAYYAAAAKDIQASATSKITENGREVTLITYELIKTPDNETGEVVGGETLVVPYVYRKVVTNKLVPNNPPVVEEETLKVTRFHSDTGEELQSDVVGFEDAPEIIGDYQFTGTTETNEAGDVQTHIYTKIQTEVPGDAPQVDVPELKVTRYQTEDGTEIKDSEEGFVDAPNTIGDYQFTGVTNMNEGNDVQTHIYSKIVTEVPGDAPSVDVPALKVTRYQTEDGIDIKDSEEGFVDAPNTIGNYQFTGVTNMNEGNDVQTHIYSKIVTEIPSDAPKREPEEIQITLHVDEETGKELVEYDPGLTSPKEIEHYTYTGKTTQEEGIRTHYYKKVITEVPGDAPIVEVPELKVTRYQTEDGTEIKDSEEGFVDAPNTIGNYQFTGTTNMNEGNDVQTHIYSKIVTDVPGDAPQVDVPELRLTRHVDEKGNELAPIEEGLNGPRKSIGDYEYTGRTDSNKAGDVLIHVYHKVAVESKVPGDAPQYDIPELKVTRHVDEKGKELIETEKGTQPPRKTIRENEYTGRTTEKDGITTHVYAPIKHEIPGDAPVVDVPELKVTRYVNEKGEEIKGSEAGFIDAPKTIGEYEFTGKTELNDGKDVQTHIYKLVEKPVTPTPDPKKPETPSPRTPEPKKPETPQPEAPKPIETPKSNDFVVESVDQPQFVKNELPKTGETNSNLALVGVSLLTALGLIGFAKRKHED